MKPPADRQTGTDIRPFTIAIPQEALDDLQQRLARTRFPAAAPGDSWDYGTPVSYLQDMVARWQDFDWRAAEARMNAFPNFTHRDRRPADPLRPRPLRRAERHPAAARPTPTQARSPSSST